MSRKEEEQIAATLAKAMAMICVRNTKLENLHTEKIPVTRTGDFSDVFVVDADGNRVPWTEMSRLDDEEMCDLMRQVVDPLYPFQMRFGDSEFQIFVERWLGAARKWNELILDPSLPGFTPPDAADLRTPARQSPSRCP